MAAVGCIAPIALALLGMVVGHLAVGAAGLPWGLGIGLALGAGIAALTLRIARAARDD